MKFKTTRILETLLLGTLILSGCSSNTTSSADKKTPTTTVSHKKNITKKTSITSSKTLWNDDKDAKLKQFIDQWAPTMNQSYVEYDGHHSIKLATGTTYPSDLKHVTVNSKHTSIGWNKRGNGSYKYNVVAIYNYNGTENHITYFFAFHDDKPVVLVDQSTSGTPNLLPTENNQLKSGFENIVNGQKAEVENTTDSNDNNNSTETDNDNNTDSNENSNNSSTQSVSDPKLVGPMLYELDRNFDMSDIPHLQLTLTDGRYYIGTGSITSNLPFTVQGNTVHYWTLLYTGTDKRPDGTYGPSPETEHTISLNDLSAKYYSTDSQKQTLDQVAAQMRVVQ